MTEKTRRRADNGGAPESLRRPLLLRIGLCLLLLGVIAFSVYQCTGHVTVGMETLRTQEITETAYVAVDLYVFRDEAPVTVDGNLYAYDVENGQKVSDGAHLLTAYRSDRADELQTALNAYPAQMAWISNSDRNGTLAEVHALSDAMERDYLAMLAHGERGELADVFGYADTLLDAMSRYDALIGSSVDNALTVEALQAQREAWLSGITATDTLTAHQSGYFYYGADGYETVFDYNAVMTMTPEEFWAMTDAAPASVAEGTAGKLVYSATWYGAAFVPTMDADVFLANREAGVTCYTVTCAGGVELLLELERLEYTEDGALLVFSSCSMPEGFDFSRRLHVETAAYSVSGYRIPAESVVTVTDGQGAMRSGVYVLEGNVVEFRRIGILRRYDGYLIVRTYEEEMARVEAMDEEQRAAYEKIEYNYLQMNDNIITRGTGLYHGKMMG